jgi:hypothetical protein
MKKMFKYKRMAIDFDGTLVEDSKDIEKDFKNKKIPKAINGAKEATLDFKKKGFEILIFTCRPDYHRPLMEKILKKHKICYDYILFYTKPRVDIYIDNKGYRFENWQDTKQYINFNLKK